MPGIFVGKASQRPAIRQSQPALGAFHGLNVRLFIHANHHRIDRRGQIQPHDVGGLALKFRIGGNGGVAG